MVVVIFVEGGGNTRHQKIRFRQSLGTFLEEAGFVSRKLRVMACGGREAAYDAFNIAHNNTGSDYLPILLVDSETPVSTTPWDHLAQRSGDRWRRPPKVSEEQAQLMVQCMESWFLADRERLKEFYGQEFREGSLPANPRIEDIPKDDVLDGLKNATRNCKTKGKYSKGRHAFDILEGLDPQKVRDASPHAERLINTLERMLRQQ